MAHPNPRMILPLLVITTLGVGGWYVEKRRASARSVLSGFFESQPTQVASRLSGRVARILVQEGDSVEAGQPLLEFESAPAQAETEAKVATAEQLQAQWREVRNGPRLEEIRRQEAVVAEAQAALARLENGFLPEEIAAGRAKLRQTEARLRRALQGARPEEKAQAQAADRNAKARLAQAERGLTAEERAQVRARRDVAFAQETLAREDAARMETLFREGAVSAQQWDKSRADLRAAQARLQEMEEALKRAEAGTPAEELAQVQEAYRQTKAALALVLAGSRREDIEAARAERDAARQDLKRLERGSRAEDLAAARARLAQGQAQLDALRAGSRREQIAQARAATRAAQANANASKRVLAERVIRAPQAGTVERVLVAVGDLLGAGTPVLRLSDPQNLWMRVYIAETKLAGVSVGSEVELSVDGVSEPVLAAVESVATQGEFTPANLQTPDERGKQTFGVRLRLKRPDPRIKAGMYATVKRIGEVSL